MRNVSVTVVAAGLVLAAALVAQNDRGLITGTVQDPAHAVVPNATVIATHITTGVEYRTVTTDTGNYTIPSLPAGHYRLTITAAGFKQHNVADIEVQVAQTNRVDAQMEVGAPTESVTVTAEAPLLKTESGEQSTVIQGTRLNDLPLNFSNSNGGTGTIRSPYYFNVLSPGVSGTLAAGQGDTNNINGLPASTFRVQVEGQDATSQNDIGWTSTVSQPGVDMIQEFSLQTSNFAAEFGQIGGGLYNFTTKSGTNALHGTGYEYFVNEDLNAYRPNTFVNPRSRKNDFGGTLGGPVYIPKIYDGRNKTFFFVSVEIYRNTLNTAGNYITLPTAGMRGGDFGALLTGKQLGQDPLGRPIMQDAIYDPASVQNVNGQLVTDPFTNNLIPGPRLDAVAKKIQGLIPNPTNTALTNNFAQLAGNYHNQAIPAFKIDHLLPDTSKVSFYFSKQLTDQLTGPDGLPDPITAVRVQAIYGTTARLNYDKSLTPTLLFHSGFGVQRFHNPDSSPASVLNYDAAAQLGFVGSATNPGGFPRIQGLGGALSSGSSVSFGPSNANSYYDTGLTGNSTLSYVRDNHTFKLGAEWRLDSWTDRNSRNSQGQLNFSANQTGLPYLNTTTIGGGTIGFPYASFLLGQVDNALVNAVQDPQWRKQAWGLFLQDTWKVTRRLTLDYGLRWDWQSEGHEIDYRSSELGPRTPNPAAGNLLGAVIYEGYGAGRCNCNFMQTYPFAIGPRIGAAFQLDSKTVLRGGWGVSYGQVPTYFYITNAAQLGVGFNSQTFTPPAYGQPGATLSGGLHYDLSSLYQASLDPGIVPRPGLLNAPGYYLDPNAGRPSRIMQWSIGLQRQITRDLALELSYVGNRGVWESQGGGIFAGNTLVNLNATNPARLAALGIDPTTPAGQSLLLSTFKSGTPQANGFNLPYAAYPTGTTLAQFLRPFPQFGSNITDTFAPLNDSWYDSLQAKVTKRYSRGLTVDAAFTWAKAQANPGGSVNNVFNRGVNKSITGFDQPFIFNVGYTYEIQKFGSNKLLQTAVAGWTVGGLLEYASGMPIPTPFATTNQFSLYYQSTLMNRVPNTNLFNKDLNCHCVDPYKDFAFNTAAWTNPTPGNWGISAPYYSDFRYQRRPGEQMSLGRTFRVKEGMSLLVRAEFFNIFNRTYLANPNAFTAPTQPQARNSLGQPISGFGYINPTSLYSPPRNGQLVARFTF